MARVELTDLYLKSLAPPERGRLEISDVKRPGLRFRLTSGGTASWAYVKRIKGGELRRHTLGNWPKPISLATARKLAAELEFEASQGIDRVADKRAAKEAEAVSRAKLKTVREAIDAYEAMHLSTLRTGAERKRQLLSALEGQLDTYVSLLTRSDLRRAVDAKIKEGRRTYSNRVRAALLAFATWLYQREYTSENIGQGLPKDVKEKDRERLLSIDEVRAIWDAAGELSEPWPEFVRLLLLTGQRRSEISDLVWREVDLDAQTITKAGADTKNERGHVTHLSQPAAAILGGLSGQNKVNKGPVFTSSTGGPLTIFAHIKKKLDRSLPEDMEPWRFHDFRTAMATHLAERGIGEGVVDRILNHAASASKPSMVARVYNRASMLEQRAAALDLWAQIVTSADEGAKVVQLHA